MDIADIKKELSNDEKVLESAFKLETLYKKHKLKIWLVIVVVVGSLFANILVTKMENERLLKANDALLVLQADEANTEALETLKTNNPNLFDLYRYSVAVENEDKSVLSQLQNNTNDVISDASKYALLTMDSKVSDSKLYREFSIIADAYSAIKAGDMTKANEKLELIEVRSPLRNVANYLKHATIKGQ